MSETEFAEKVQIVGADGNELVVNPDGSIGITGGGGGGSGTVTDVTAADGSVVIGGTPTVSPTVRTGTLDAIATAHPPVAAVAMNSQKITGLADGAAAQDAAAFGQIATALGAYVPKSLYDAQSALVAVTDDTPAAVTFAASTIMARLAAGNLKACTVAEIVTLLSALQVTIIDAKGDLIAGTGADAAARLAAGSNDTVLICDSAQSTGLKYAQIATAQIAAAAGILVTQLGDVGAGKVLTSAGSGNVADYPPGYQFDYVQITSNATSTATTDATATATITGSSVTYDGSTTIMIEGIAPAWYLSAGGSPTMNLYDGSTDLGRIAYMTSFGAGYGSVFIARRKITPSAGAHVYSLRLWVPSGTGTLVAGAGGTATYLPAFLRQIKV